MPDRSGTAVADMSSSAEPREAIPVSYRRRLCSSVNVISTAPPECTAVAPASTTDADLSAEKSAMPDRSMEAASMASLNPTDSVPDTKSATGGPGARSGRIASGVMSREYEVVPAKKFPRESRTAEPDTSISMPGSASVSASRSLSRTMPARCVSVMETSTRLPSTEACAPARTVGLSPCASFSEMPPAATCGPMSLSNASDSVPVPKSTDAPVSSGRTVSMTMSRLYDSEPARPGTGSASAASEREPSAVLIVPPSSSSDIVPTYPRSDELWPWTTAYRNAKTAVPLPDTYAARASAAPVSSSSFGVPVTDTGSENSTSTSIVLPLPYVPSAAVDVALTTTAFLPISITYAAPRDSLSSAPTTRSPVPSRLRSPANPTDLPKPSLADSVVSGRLRLFIATVRLTEPSGFKKITCASLPPGAPATRSGVPSLSTSPAAETAPRASPPAIPGPLGVEPFISAVLLTVPSEFMYIMCSAPVFSDALLLVPSSLSAPAAISATPSPSRSPMPATEEPNMSPSESDGPFAVVELISAVLFTVPSEFMYRTWTAPLEFPPASSPLAPAATSGTPSRSRSPMPATEEPNWSKSARDRLPVLAEFISAVLFTVPSGLRNRMWTAPLESPPASSPIAPAAMSGTPSRSRSPMPATEVPNESWSASEGPLGVPAPIRAMLATVPSRSMNRTRTEPRSRPPPSSPGAPTAKSATPSRSTSPTPAAPAPKSSPVSSSGPFLRVSSSIAVLLGEPSVSMNTMWTAPVSLLKSDEPASYFSAPAASSGTPSPSRSPSAAAEEPKKSASESEGPFAVVESILAVLLTVPSELRNMTWSAPLVFPPASSPTAPAATSGTPSPSRSPAAATEYPKKSPFESEGPFAVVELISAVLFTVPSGFMYRTWTAPLWLPPASSPHAPAAMSGTPSPSRSPRPAAEAPKLSLSASEGPFAVVEFISAVLFTVPSEFMYRMWSAPLPLPPASSFGAPAAISATPSPSRSPMPATDEPKVSSSASEGPLVVDEFISAVLFTVPSGFMYRMWTAPLQLPPASSPLAPTAMSGVPSPSRSPMPATEVPNSSLSASEGPLAVDEPIVASLRTVPSSFVNTRVTAPRSAPPPSA